MAEANQLPGDLLQRLHHALLHAYPDRSDFAQFLLFQMEVRLDAIASTTAGMSTVHFEVLQWFLVRNRLAEFVQEASTNRPQNEELAALYAEIVQYNQPEETSPMRVMKENASIQRVPGWVFVITGVIFLAFLVWAGVRLVGRSGIGPLNANRPEAESTIAISSAEGTSTIPATRSSLAPSSQPSQTPTTSPTSTTQPSRTPTRTRIPVPTQTVEPNTPVQVESQLRPADGMEMVFVPAGNFLMGSNAGDPDADDDEMPQHEVSLDAFWIDKTEVTNRQFGLCVAGGVCSGPINLWDSTFSGADYPVIGVSWFDADKYCNWVGGRLPTEAEWEYAARGPAGFQYPWGNDFNGEFTNFCDLNCEFEWHDLGVDDGFANTGPVGSYPSGASWVQAQDLVGNVWEWVFDWYDSGYYATSSSDNPSGPTSGENKIMRGGGWVNTLPIGLRVADRQLSVPDAIDNFLGFRCAITYLE